MNGNFTPTNNRLLCSKFLTAFFLCSTFTHRYTAVVQQCQTAAGNSHFFCKPPIRLVLLIALLITGIKVRLHSNRRKISNIRKLIRKLQDGARNVIPLIVHVTHFYYYKDF